MMCFIPSFVTEATKTKKGLQSRYGLQMTRTMELKKEIHKAYQLVQSKWPISAC